MKAVITSASEVDHNGCQSVAFDVVEGATVLLSHSLTADVDAVQGAIVNFLNEYNIKYLSENKVAAGQEIEV